MLQFEMVRQANTPGRHQEPRQYSHALLSFPAASSQAPVSFLIIMHVAHQHLEYVPRPGLQLGTTSPTDPGFLPPPASAPGKEAATSSYRLFPQKIMPGKQAAEKVGGGQMPRAAMK